MNLQGNVMFGTLSTAIWKKLRRMKKETLISEPLPLNLHSSQTGNAKKLEETVCEQLFSQASEDADFFNEDPQNWSKELLEAYDELKLPTLYECVLANEQMSLEIKKQNKTVKALVDSVDQLKEELKKQRKQLGGGFEELMHTLSEQHVVVSSSCDNQGKRLYQDVVMEAMDSVHVIVDQIQKTWVEEAGPIVWKKEKIQNLKQREQMAHMRKTLRAFHEGFQLIQEKWLSSLQSLDLEQICPKEGDVFSPYEHRAVLKIEGERSGVIQKTVRPGYMHQGKVLRCADVVIYSLKKRVL